jgi:hypothetical protein
VRQQLLRKCGDFETEMMHANFGVHLVLTLVLFSMVVVRATALFILPMSIDPMQVPTSPFHYKNSA